MKVPTFSKKLVVAALIAGSWLAFETGQKAQAATFSESGDAGQTLGTAQAVNNGTNAIQGTIGTNDDADLFSFNWSGGAFNATAIGGASFDILLGLIDSTGNVVVQNDDTYVGGFFTSLQSTLSLPFLAAGQYFLGVSFCCNFPGTNFQNVDFATGQFFNAGPLNYQNDPRNGAFGYTVRLNQPTTAIPTPALLPGLVGLGVAALRRRKTEVVEETSEA